MKKLLPIIENRVKRKMPAHGGQATGFHSGVFLMQTHTSMEERKRKLQTNVRMAFHPRNPIDIRLSTNKTPPIRQLNNVFENELRMNDPSSICRLGTKAD